MGELSEVVARMSIDIIVDCPHCDRYINLMDPDDTNGHDHNECGYLLQQACPSNEHWSEAHKDFECEEVTCSECKNTFNVKGLDW